MTTERTAVALRVLMAYNKKEPPNPNDVAILRAYCPDGRDLDPDEMACIVIQRMLDRRKQASENRLNA